MKKLFLPVLFLFVVSCSVDNDNLPESEVQFSELNAAVEIEGCEAVSYDFGDVGKIEVTNDSEKLYVTVASTSENYDLLNSKLHIVNVESDFPTVGKGNLPPGKMEHQIEFDPQVDLHTFEISLSDFSSGECIFIASQSSFSNGESTITSWAGDHHVSSGNWSYFQYCIQECIPACSNPIYTGPNVLYGTITYTAAKAVPSVDEARKLFSNLIVQTGEYYGTSRGLGLGNYSPSIHSLVKEFETLVEPFTTYDLKTTYFYGEGECAGTIDITLTITDDRPTQ